MLLLEIMKKTLNIFLVLLLGFGSFSCMKQNPYEIYDGQAFLEKEKPILEEYVSSTAELEGAILDEETGIWYKIFEEGVGPGDEDFYQYRINSYGNIEAPIVTVTYEGKLVSNGVTFEKKEDENFSLAAVISGWLVAFLPFSIEDDHGKVHKINGLMKNGLQKGSKMRLVIPSPYGYRNNELPGIPANSPLDYVVEAKKVSPPQSQQ